VGAQGDEDHQVGLHGEEAAKVAADVDGPYAAALGLQLVQIQLAVVGIDGE
jgi:hypothetical protein